MTAFVLPLLLLAAGIILTAILLTEGNRRIRAAAATIEAAIRPPIAPEDVAGDVDTWCCELAVLTHGRDHKGGQPCSR